MTVPKGQEVAISWHMDRRSNRHTNEAQSCTASTMWRLAMSDSPALREGIQELRRRVPPAAYAMSAPMTATT